MNTMFSVRDFILKFHKVNLDKKVFIVIGRERFSINDIQYKTDNGITLKANKSNNSLSLEEILRILHYINLESQIFIKVNDDVFLFKDIENSIKIDDNIILKLSTRDQIGK